MLAHAPPKPFRPKHILLMMLYLIVSPKNLHSPRLHYVLEVLFHRMAGLKYQTTTQHLPKGQNKNLLISYGPQPHPQADLHIPEEGLLGEVGLRNSKPQKGFWKNHPTLFPQQKQSKNSLPFDLFSAAFFLISRYEEYQFFQADEHGRFPLTASVLYQTDYPKKPLVNHWLEALLQTLKQKHNQLKYAPPPYRFRPSYDTDLPWSLAHKHPLQALGGSLRDLLQHGPKALIKRYHIWRKPETDPAFTFPFLQKLHRHFQLQPIYFAPTGNYGRYDKAPSHRKSAYQKLLRQLAKEGDVGLHPSYKTLERPDLLIEEKQRLEKIIDRPITQSRQHFLRFRFPQTPRQLLEAGIEDDYSLGFAERPGFRMACCMPVPWYDLQEEKQTKLTLHPLPLMDVSLTQYLQLNAEARRHLFGQICSEIKKFGGEFTPLWHNNHLSTSKARKEYESFLRLASGV